MDFNGWKFTKKGDNYKLSKHDLKFEDYLDVLDDQENVLTC